MDDGQIVAGAIYSGPPRNLLGAGCFSAW
jgi:hypothetical protein